MYEKAIAIFLVLVIATSGCINNNISDEDNSAQMAQAEIVDITQLNFSESAKVDCEKYFSDDAGEFVSPDAKCYKQEDGSVIMR